MLNYLQDCQRTTPIGMLPGIINHNNQAIDAEFNWIYDASLNRLTKSVYAPTGSVKAHFGEFVNLSVEYLTVKNPGSLKATLEETVNSIVAANSSMHNLYNGRYSSPDAEQLFGRNYMHDAASIAFDSSYNVYTKIESFDSSIAEMNAKVQAVMDSSVEGDFQNIDASITELKEADSSIMDYVDANFININTSINDVKSYVDTTNTRIDTVEQSVNEAEQKIINLTASVQQLYNSEASSVQMPLENFSFKHNNKIYTATDIAKLLDMSQQIQDLIEWKNNLATENLAITTEGNQSATYKILYER